MKSVFTQVGILFGALIVVFFVFYSVFEQSTLNKTEQEVLAIYEAQLESILFSINQYTQDEVEAWMRQANEDILNGMDPDFRLFLDDRPINMMFTAKSDNAVISIVSASGNSETLDSLLNANYKTLQLLFGYLEADYQKLQPVIDNNSNFYLVFALKESPGMLAGFRIDPDVFIAEMLAPRLQEVAKNEMILTAFDPNDAITYSTDNENLLEDEIIKVQESGLWLFPSYYLGISFRGESLNDLMDERTRNNWIFFAMIAFVLLVGITFIIRGVSRELRLTKMKSDFVSNVSHEIRTPLSLISMFAETLEMGRVKDEKERDKFYHIINSETRRLSGLVNRILNFSKMEAGKKSYTMERLDLNQVVDEVLLSYDYQLTTNGFACDFARSANMFVGGDKESIYEAVVNLLDNAIKYSGAARKIQIRTSETADSNIISITDFGMGVAEKDQKRVFEKFYRAEDSLIHNTKGSGLGLNIVFEIMQAHHGKVTMHSKLGHGSTFELIFPKKVVAE